MEEIAYKEIEKFKLNFSNHITMMYLLKPVYEKCILINTTNSSLLQDIF